MDEAINDLSETMTLIVEDIDWALAEDWSIEELRRKLAGIRDKIEAAHGELLGLAFYAKES